MIDFEHVSKEYKKGGPLALEDINFHVDEGEFVFLLGHSGAGKSTLLKLILREETPTEGKVTVLGKDVARLRRHQVPYLRRQMGIIFQDFRLIPSMTVYENVAFAMHVTNVKHKEIADRVDYMLELVHLANWSWTCWPASSWTASDTSRALSPPTWPPLPDCWRCTGAPSARPSPLRCPSV